MAMFSDETTFSVASWASSLELLDKARGNLLFFGYSTRTFTMITNANIIIRISSISATMGADDFSIIHEFEIISFIDIFKRDAQF